ncbi:unnamed protein product [Alopecurus aequalis]
MAEIAVLLVIKKIGIAVAAETVKYVEKKAGLVAVLPQNMRLIHNDLELMQAFLKDISTKGCTDRVTEAWIGQARILAYDIEDIVDQFIYVVGGHHQEGTWWGYVKKIVKKPQSVFTLDEISSALDRINEQITHLKGNKDWTKPIAGMSDVPAAGYDSQQQQYLPGHDYTISDDELVGLDKNKETLNKSLNLEESSHLQIIAVWGMGGIGKSTLVNSVFKTHSSTFECHAWVSVSQSYKLDDIWRSMLKGINSKGKKECNAEIMSSAELQVQLKKILEKKRYLIILDDVWTASDLFKIKEVLVDTAMGSRVIITTRTDDVASIADDVFKIRVEPLDKDDAWRLFCRKAFPRVENHICPKLLHECGKSIVDKCGGLPLAIVAIGSILCLKEKTVTAWRIFYDQFIWELHNNKDLNHVNKILNLSYKYLPDHLKSCFLYCALFPEDFMIHRKRLIRYWVAEGFIEQIGACSLEDVAEIYLTELVRRSMLQVVERNSFNRIKCLRMHDLVRELAIFQSKRESFSTNFDDSHGVVQMESNSRRMSVLQCKNDNDIQSSISQCRLRTFIAFSTSMALSSWFFSGSKYLAVLELSGLPIKTIPKSIGGLFNLRYLGLDNTNVEVLPKSVLKLQNLETLSLRDTNCLSLPQGFKKLKRLRHILAYKLLDKKFSIFESYESVKPFEGLWSLNDLQTLKSVRASEVFVAKLANLCQLRYLSITGLRSIHCAQLCDSLSKMHKLSSLEIKASNEDEVLQLESLELSSCLKKLVLLGRFSEGTLESPLFSISGDALHEIYLFWSQLVENPLPCLSKLSNLTVIYLKSAYTGQELNFQPGWFPNVNTIILRDMPHVNQVCIYEGALVRLEILSIRGLIELRTIPTGLEHLKSFKQAQFTGMHDDFKSNVKATNLKHIAVVFF